MEIILDFNKLSGCKKMEKFLMDNLQEKDQDSLRAVLSGKSVVKANVIGLVITLVRAMTITNEVDMEDFEAASVTAELRTQISDPRPQNRETDEEELQPTQGSSGTQFNKVTQESVSKQVKNILDPTKICQFYANNKCKFGKDCKKSIQKYATNSKRVV